MVIRILVSSTTRGHCYNGSANIEIFYGFVFGILMKFYILGRKKGVRIGMPNKCILSVKQWIS